MFLRNETYTLLDISTSQEKNKIQYYPITNYKNNSKKNVHTGKYQNVL